MTSSYHLHHYHPGPSHTIAHLDCHKRASPWVFCSHPCFWTVCSLNSHLETLLTRKSDHVTFLLTLLHWQVPICSTLSPPPASPPSLLSLPLPAHLGLWDAIFGCPQALICSLHSSCTGFHLCFLHARHFPASGPLDLPFPSACNTPLQVSAQPSCFLQASTQTSPSQRTFSPTPKGKNKATFTPPKVLCFVS